MPYTWPKAKQLASPSNFPSFLYKLCDLLNDRLDNDFGSDVDIFVFMSFQEVVFKGMNK